MPFTIGGHIDGAMADSGFVNRRHLVFFHARSKHRPFHLGSIPFEVLPRNTGVTATGSARPATASPAARAYEGLLAGAVLRYCEIIAKDIQWRCGARTRTGPR